MGSFISYSLRYSGVFGRSTSLNPAVNLAMLRKKLMSQHQITARMDERRGLLKENPGTLLYDKGLKTQGPTEKLTGKIRSGLVEGKEKAKELIDKISLG